MRASRGAGLSQAGFSSSRVSSCPGFPPPFVAQADDAFTPVWTKLSQAGEAPSKRSGHTFTEVNGSGFLFGGERVAVARAD